MTTKRRTIAAGLLAAPALLHAAGPPAGAAASRAEQPGGQIEPGAGSWRTWVLRSGGELRPPPPPAGAAGDADAAELRALLAQRDELAAERIAYWDAGAPGFRWNELALARVLTLPSLVRGYRVLALLNVAISDATVAAWDAKYAYRRPPAERG